jgi:hypothetical protein
MKKKIIVLGVSKSVAEIDWILPVLFELKKDYKIFTLFQRRDAYNTLKIDKILFKLWNEVSDGYKIDDKIDKIWRLLDQKFFLNKTINYFFGFNIKNYFKKNKINFSEIAVFFSEFGTYSPFVSYIKKENVRPKIIHFPTSAFIFAKPRLNEKVYYSLGGDNLILCNDSDVESWSKRIAAEKIKVVGVPKYDLAWLNKLIPSIKKNKKPIILIAYSSRFKFEKEKNEKQLNEIMQVLSGFTNYKIIFKIHPRRNDPFYLKILKKFKNVDFEISRENLLTLASKCDIFLHDRDSSVLLEGLIFKKPSIEYWEAVKLINRDIGVDVFKLNVIANNSDELKRLIGLAADNPSHEIWKIQKQNFISNCKKYGENATKHCVKVINGLLSD